MSPRRTSLGGAAVAALAALLAGCTSVIPGEPSAADPAAGLEAYYDQQLTWGSCETFAADPADTFAFADPQFECARLEVPLDYAAPAGRRAQLAVLRQKALGERTGSLVINPGGPGASGTSAVVNIVAPGAGSGPIAQRFDIVGFDPRGVGASTPTIDCLTDDEWDVERADLDLDPSPEGIEAAEAESRLFVQRCVERSGGVEVLANIGTRDAARDLDVLRAALGDDKLTYLGYSYGTGLGSAYAEAFPRNVRALVLDGALDPTMSTVDQLVAQNKGFQQAFDAYAADCARRPTCPLGTDPAQSTARFQTLTRPLIEQPVPAGPGRELGYSDALTGVTQALYLSAAWPILTQGLTGVARGDGTLLMRLADAYYDRGPDGSYQNKLEAFRVINCVDDERITDRAEVAEIIERVVAVAPFRDDGQPVVPALDACAFWPVPPTSRPHVPDVTGLPRTLVISVTGDPATPYQAGVDLAAAIDGTLLSVTGNQHTAALRGDECVDGIVTAYLVDLELPDGEASCTL
ncbi:MAG: alpha/beta hydrolase [Pseudonocardia sp.]